MPRWTEEDDAKLKAAAAEAETLKAASERIGRSPPACAGRAARIGVLTWFRLADHLRAGGAITRDVCGGIVGVRWCDATRGGDDFSREACEALLLTGRLRLQPGASAAYGLAA